MTKTATELESLSVNEVIRRFPGTVEVFNRHGIDACCGGAATIGDAAVRDGADADVVLAEVRSIVEAAA